jgi:Family of unknown function (DUF5427)
MTTSNAKGDEDVLSLLDSLGDSAPPPTTAAAAPADDSSTSVAENEKELLGFLDDLAKPSRSQTPRPATTRTSRDSARGPLSAGKKPIDKPVDKPIEQTKEPEASGGWLGGLWSIGSAAMKTAEQKVKELQQTDEAKVWEEKLRGNVSVLGKLGKPSSCHTTHTDTKAPIYEHVPCPRCLPPSPLS